MLTPLSADLVYRSNRSVSSKTELARQLGVRISTLSIYEDVLCHDPSEIAICSPTKCDNCYGTGYAPPPTLVEVAAKITPLRPIPDISIDQCPLIPIDLARRVHVLLEFHQPGSTSFAFVGDDDLATLLLLSVCEPRRVLVVDIDQRVLDTLERNTSDVKSANLSLRSVNLAYLADALRLLEHDIGNYDVAVTDPPYADDGMLMFVYTASALLKLGGRLYLAVPHLTAESWTDDLMQLVQSELLDLGFVVSMLVPAFFAYSHSDVLSSLLVATKRRNIAVDTLVERAGKINLHRFYTTRYPI